PPDTAEGDGPRQGVARGRLRARRTDGPRRLQRPRRTRGLSRLAGAIDSADRRHLLERPDGDRRAAGGCRRRDPRPPRSVRRRIRRHRRDTLDEPAAHDGRAADRRDCGDGRKCAEESDRGSGQAAAGLLLPPAARAARVDGAAGVTLTAEKCVACRRDAPTVTGAEIAELQPEVPEWELVEIDGVERLRRVFTFDDFAEALEVQDAVA